MLFIGHWNAYYASYNKQIKIWFELPVIMLEMMSGRMRSFSMRMRISPGKPKYCLWRWDRDAYSLVTRPKPIPEKSEGRSQIKSRLKTKIHRMSKKTTIMFMWMQKWKCHHHIISEAGMVSSSQNLLNSFNLLHFDWLRVFICVYICNMQLLAMQTLNDLRRTV